jgi:hypothetical protein
MSFGMWRRVDIVLTDVSEEDCLLHSHRRENVKSYKRWDGLYFNIFKHKIRVNDIRICSYFTENTKIAHARSKQLKTMIPMDLLPNTSEP